MKLKAACFFLCVLLMAVHLGPFEVGQIWALHREGFSHRQIADKVTRGRGQAVPPAPKCRRDSRFERSTLPWHRQNDITTLLVLLPKFNETASRVPPDLAWHRQSVSLTSPVSFPKFNETAVEVRSALAWLGRMASPSRPSR